jgi:hypothetical protein
VFFPFFFASARKGKCICSFHEAVQMVKVLRFCAEGDFTQSIINDLSDLLNINHVTRLCSTRVLRLCHCWNSRCWNVVPKRLLERQSCVVDSKQLFTLIHICFVVAINGTNTACTTLWKSKTISGAIKYTNFLQRGTWVEAVSLISGAIKYTNFLQRGTWAAAVSLLPSGRPKVTNTTTWASPPR